MSRQAIDQDEARGTDLIQQTTNYFDEINRKPSPADAINHFLKRLLNNGGYIGFITEQEDFAALPVITDCPRYAVAAEILQLSCPASYLAFGPFGTEPAIEARSPDDANDRAISIAKERFGSNAKVLIRETWKL